MDLNHRPALYESAALPAELHRRKCLKGARPLLVLGKSRVYCNIKKGLTKQKYLLYLLKCLGTREQRNWQLLKP